MYGQAAPVPVYTWKHYAVVAAVGALIGTVFRGTAPWALGALAYALGFWVRGRQTTPLLLEQAVAIGQSQAQRFQAATHGAYTPFFDPTYAPHVQPGPIGAGVQYDPTTQTVIHVQPGPAVIDAELDG